MFMCIGSEGPLMGRGQYTTARIFCIQKKKLLKYATTLQPEDQAAISKVLLLLGVILQVKQFQLLLTNQIHTIKPMDVQTHEHTALVCLFLCFPHL